MLVNHCRRVNYVEELTINGILTKRNDSLREAASKYFETLYTESINSKPRLDGLSYNNLNNVDCSQLEMKFIEDEVQECLHDYDGDKAPGPDGFNFKFLQTFGDILKKDIMEFFNDFHKHGSFVKSINSTFIIMISKKI